MNSLADWAALDTWIVVIAALTALACALPGTFLVLRRESLMGDALSHATLPGIVLAYVIHRAFEESGWLSADFAETVRPASLFFGAACTSVLCGVLTTGLQRWGRLEPSAALGVVYTTFFAMGLLLIRAWADRAHIDPSCVLYGNLELAAIETWGGTGIPTAALVSGGMLLINGVLLAVFYKELLLSTFDPDQARALGIPADRVHLALLAITGGTVVAAFESVGSILVMAMLIGPPATALLFSDRLVNVLLGAAATAILTAVLGHTAALTLPACFVTTGTVVPSVSTAGMMAVVGGALFLLAAVVSPKYGYVRQIWNRSRLRSRILMEDVLGVLYRLEELRPDAPHEADLAGLAGTLNVAPWRLWLADRRLQRRGWIVAAGASIALTDDGRTEARQLVRAHRLWEVYLAKHFELPDRRLHALAADAEHFVDRALQGALDAELDQPQRDPHGAAIPGRE